MTVDEANYIVNHYYYNVMKFCGCYTPGDVLNKLEEVLEYFNHGSERINSEWLGNNLVVAFLVDSLGLTEHGGSVGGAWLTRKGDNLLEALKLSDDHWDDDEVGGWSVAPARDGFNGWEDEEKAFMAIWGTK